MEILFTSKGQKRGTSTEEIIENFENSEDLEEIRELVKQAEERLSVTWASVEMKDNAGELIPMEDIVKQQDILLERGGPVTDEHTNRVIGKTIAWKLMEHPKTGSLGVLHLDKTFDHNELDDKVWSEIQNKERTGASVGGFNTSESTGKDEVTGEKVKVLEGFNQFETASVFDPCNPLALTEAFSVVAKSNKGKGEVIKPAELDICVQSLMEDPEFKPRDPTQTKEQAAFAVCQAQITKKSEVDDFWGKIDKNKNYLNNPSSNKNIKKGDTMKEDTKKTISEKKKQIDALKKEIEKLKKEDENMEEEKQEEEKPKEAKKQEEEEKEDDMEEKKKQEEEEEKQEEPEEKKKKQEEGDMEEDDAAEEKKKVKKEEARGEIEGEEPAAEQPEAPEPEAPNDQDVFKQLKQVQKQLKDLKGELVEKTSTPRPSGPKNFVEKAEKMSKTAMDLVTGKTRKTWNEVHKMMRDIDNEGVI